MSEQTSWPLWGKTMRDGDRVQRHPLLCHLVDAAEVAGVRPLRPLPFTLQPTTLCSTL
jgi:hypothetical protein